jgi:hypothetical protein
MGELLNGSLLSERFTPLGACVEEQRPRTSGIDTIGPVALDKTENSDGGSKALFGMWA